MASSTVRPQPEDLPGDQDLPGGQEKLPRYQVPIRSDDDVVEARLRGRRVAERQGFSPVEITLITTAISEVARNIVIHAGCGQLAVGMVEIRGRRGLEVTARDDGPGIADVDLAMTDGYSTRRGLGLGLPGVRRLMDEVELHTMAGVGTTVVLRKWPGGGGGFRTRFPPTTATTRPPRGARRTGPTGRPTRL
jgi:serine/threonine-protein kinase RsbT